MVNQAGRFLSAHNRLVKRLQRQCLGPHRIRQGPSDNAAGEHIGDKGGIYTEVTAQGYQLLNKARPTNTDALEAVLECLRTDPTMTSLVDLLHADHTR